MKLLFVQFSSASYHSCSTSWWLLLWPLFDPEDGGTSLLQKIDGLVVLCDTSQEIVLFIVTSVRT
jgi:hypothetical protein